MNAFISSCVKPVEDSGGVTAVAIGREKELPTYFGQMIHFDRGQQKLRYSSKRFEFNLGETALQQWPLIANCPVVATPGAVLIGTFGLGILAFDKASGEAIPLGSKAGMPSDIGWAMVSQGDKIYATLGFGAQGTYIIEMDTHEKKLLILASSQRISAYSALDKVLEPFLVVSRLMVSDPDRHRVLFGVSSPHPQAGLWKIDTQTHRISRIMAWNYDVPWMGTSGDHELLIAATDDEHHEWAAVSFDMTNDKSRIVYSSVPGQPIFGIKPDEQTLQSKKFYVQPPYLIVDGWLWASIPFCRLSLDQKKQQLLPPPGAGFLRISNPDMPEELNVSWRTLRRLSDGQLLVSNRNNIWLLELKPEASSTQPARPATVHDP